MTKASILFESFGRVDLPLATCPRTGCTCTRWMVPFLRPLQRNSTGLFYDTGAFPFGPKRCTWKERSVDGAIRPLVLYGRSRHALNGSNNPCPVVDDGNSAKIRSTCPSLRSNEPCPLRLKNVQRAPLRSPLWDKNGPINDRNDRKQRQAQ